MTAQTSRIASAVPPASQDAGANASGGRVEPEYHARLDEARNTVNLLAERDRLHGPPGMRWRINPLLIDRLHATPRSEGVWTASCPACERHGTLSVVREPAGKLRPSCTSGCTQPVILAHVGLRASDLLPVIIEKPDEFTLMPLSRLLAEPSESIGFVWDQTLPAGGLSILGAKPKVGKSTFARTLALAVSAGLELLGRRCARGPVVYLALEDKRDEFRQAFTRAGGSAESRRSIFVHTGRAPREAMAALRKAVAAHAPALVIVDTLQKLVRVGDLNDYAQVNLVMEDLMEIARVSGAHICVLHHFNKAAGTGGGDGGDGLLGSTALFGAVDCLLEMHKKEEMRTLRSTQRYGTDLPETVMNVCAHTGLVFPTGPVADAAGRALRDRIMAVLDTPRTERDLVELLESRRLTICEALRRLMKDGLVCRTGEGVKGSPFVYTSSGPQETTPKVA